jgi:hypothetical protein
MLKCKTCDQIFSGVYVDEENNDNESKSSNIEKYRIYFFRRNLHNYITDFYIGFP